MSNQRQIPFIHWRPRKDGIATAMWIPSPRLRALGWKTRNIGTDQDADAAMRAAIALNREVAEWQAKRGAAPQPARPARRNFGDLVHAYKASSAWSGLSDKTHREYDVRLRWLTDWAMDGTLFLDQLDKAMLLDLRDALLLPDAKGNPASLHKAASIMRVLRLLLNWAVVRDYIRSNPMDKITTPSPPSRINALLTDQVDEAAAQARADGLISIGLALTLGLWSLQRRADLLALSRMAWRPIENCHAADAAILANHRGDVMGFRLQQQKTKAWVTCPIPPSLHEQIEAAWARSDFLLSDDDDRTRAYAEHQFQRRIRATLDKAGLHGFQFRDLRRSGMMLFSQLGAELPGITAISGHKVMGGRTILDTYMPAHDRAACAAVATVMRTIAARERKDQAHG